MNAGDAPRWSASSLLKSASELLLVHPRSSFELYGEAVQEAGGDLAGMAAPINIQDRRSPDQGSPLASLNSWVVPRYGCGRFRGDLRTDRVDLRDISIIKKGVGP